MRVAWAVAVTAAAVVVDPVVRAEVEAAEVVGHVAQVVVAVVAAEAEVTVVEEAVAVMAAAVVGGATAAECPAKAIPKEEDIRFFTCSAVFC